jgi:hypothetical protein
MAENPYESGFSEKKFFEVQHPESTWAPDRAGLVRSPRTAMAKQFIQRVTARIGSPNQVTVFQQLLADLQHIDATST